MRSGEWIESDETDFEPFYDVSQRIREVPLLAVPAPICLDQAQIAQCPAPKSLIQVTFVDPVVSARSTDTPTQLGVVVS
jgi:hypothetical protein